MSFDATVSAAFWNRQNELERKQLAQEVASALSEAKRLAATLRSEAGVQAVHLFGSLAKGTTYHLGFDIDLVIVGGDELVARRIVGSSKYRIDLMDFADLPEHLRQEILKDGVIL